MIKEFELYHGVIMSRLVHSCDGPISLRLYPSSSNASYVLNGNIGIYVKHSAKRLSPWRFSFQKEHQDEILRMKNELGSIFVLLVCGKDGIVTLSFDELKTILNDSHEETEWISAARQLNQEYTIKGSDGSLKRKVGKNDFPKKLFSFNSKNTICTDNLLMS